MRVGDPEGNYSDAEVIRVLLGQAGPRRVSFRYDRLDKSNNYLGELTDALSGSVEYNIFADIKRTAKITLRDEAPINYASDRIRPWFRLRMPDGGFVEWPLGVFLLSTPTRRRAEDGMVTREVEAYDQLLVLKESKSPTRYTVNVATKYTDAIKALALDSGLVINIIPSHLILTSSREWDPGTSRLQIINDLLSAINYESAFFDELGNLVCRPYLSPADRGSEFAYRTDSASVVTGTIGQTLDLYSVPNQWSRVKSEADQPPLVSIYTNTNPASVTSTVSRGRTITDFATESDAADQATLDALVKRVAFEASQIYETIEFATLSMPIHTNADVYDVEFADLGVNSKYSETGWALELRAGASMKHKVRRVVNV